MTSVIPTPQPASAEAGQSVPVADYGMLADCASAALVSRAGSIDWLCLPRYDSPAIFARLLDPTAGHWSIRPAGDFTTERRYLPGTLVIETTFTTPAGSVRLTDALAFAEGQRGHDIGLEAPHELLRRVEGLEGRVEMVMELAPRPGRRPPSRSPGPRSRTPCRPPARPSSWAPGSPTPPRHGAPGRASTPF